jgi:hypothetical protein
MRLLQVLACLRNKAGGSMHETTPQTVDTRQPVGLSDRANENTVLVGRMIRVAVPTVGICAGNWCRCISTPRLSPQALMHANLSKVVDMSPTPALTQPAVMPPLPHASSDEPPWQAIQAPGWVRTRCDTDCSMVPQGPSDVARTGTAASALATASRWE